MSVDDNYRAARDALTALVVHADQYWENHPDHPLVHHLQALRLRRLTRYDLPSVLNDKHESVIIKERCSLWLALPVPDAEMLMMVTAEWHFGNTGTQRTIRMHQWRILESGQASHVSMHFDGPNDGPDRVNGFLYDFSHIQFSKRFPAESECSGPHLLHGWSPEELPRFPVFGEAFAGVLTNIVYGVFGRKASVSRKVHGVAYGAGERRLLTPAK